MLNVWESQQAPKPLRKSWAVALVKLIGRRPKGEVVLVGIILTAAISADQLMTAAHFFSVFYACVIAVIAWFVGSTAAVLFAALDAVLILIAGLVLPGQSHITNNFDLASYTSMRAIFFVFTALVVGRLKHVQANIESLAEARAKALATETAERERLESEMLDISEREQRRIGRDLHDGLCQLLTGAALTNSTLIRSLTTMGDLKSVETARKTGRLVEDAIFLARSTAKGLDPIELKSDGLMQALEEFSATTSELFEVRCQFRCPAPVFIESATTATHLYRVAQEAVSNAVKHSKATTIEICLEEIDEGIRAFRFQM